eukprot:4302196-Amphidinium_carterae.1
MSYFARSRIAAYEAQRLRGELGQAQDLDTLVTPKTTIQTPDFGQVKVEPAVPRLASTSPLRNDLAAMPHLFAHRAQILGSGGVNRRPGLRTHTSEDLL